MKELSRREFLVVCGKVVIVGAGLYAVPRASATSTILEVQGATADRARFNLQPHSLPDFETWMLSTARSSGLRGQRSDRPGEDRRDTALLSCPND